MVFLKKQNRHEDRLSLAPISDTVAVRCGHNVLTYSQLHIFVEDIKNALNEAGIGVGSRVGILMARSIELPISIFACLDIGATFVIIDTGYPSETIRHIMVDAELSILLTCRRHGFKPLEEGLAYVPILVLDVDNWDIKVPHLSPVPLDTPGAYISYTSGSTGRPKGVLCSHQSLYNLISWFIAEFDLNVLDGSFVMTSPSFDLTLKNIIAPLVIGGTLTMFDGSDYDIPGALRALYLSKATWLNATPTTFNLLLLEASNESFIRLSGLRYFFSGGESLRFNLIFRWVSTTGTSCVIVNTYGPTECTGIVGFTQYKPSDIKANTLSVVKGVIKHTTVEVLSEGHNPTKVGDIGEVYIGGKAVSLGYWREARQTAERFLPSPNSHGARRYRTGDTAKVRENGCFELIARTDLQIKVRGHRVVLSDIETALCTLVEIDCAAAFVTESDDGNELHAAYVKNSIHASSAVSMRDHVRASLPTSPIPTSFISVDKIPRSFNGKIDRHALADMVSAQKEPVSSAAQLSSSEQLLSRLWSLLLKATITDRYADFFELGGHSLTAMRLAYLVRQSLDIRFTVRNVFDRPTLSGMADLIDEHIGGRPAHGPDELE